MCWNERLALLRTAQENEETLQGLQEGLREKIQEVRGDEVAMLKHVMRFLKWYDKQINANVLIIAVILYLQIPHMVWVADVAFFERGLTKGIAGSPLDFLLYGVDLLEWAAIIKITLVLVARFALHKRSSKF